MGNKDKALEYQLVALNIRIKSLNPMNHADTIYSYQKVAALYEEAGQYKEALKYAYRLMDIISLYDDNSTKTLQVKLDELTKKIDSQKTDKSIKKQ